jgi:hypothetical protein
MSTDYKSEFGQEVWIDCEIRPGVFRGEFIAQFRVIKRTGPVTTAGFFDECVIEADQERPGRGWLKCWELDRHEDLVLVHLPGETDLTGQRVVVRANIVRQPA